MRMLFNKVWWAVRGVRSEDYRALCRRCLRTGQAHYSASECIRFAPLVRK